MIEIGEPNYESDFDNETDSDDLEEEEEEVVEEKEVLEEEKKEKTENNVTDIYGSKSFSTEEDLKNSTYEFSNSKQTKDETLNKNNGTNEKNRNKNIKTTSDESDIESDINESENVKRMTEQFEEMYMKFHEDLKHDIELKYTVRRKFSRSEKCFDSSTDTNNDENIQGTFEVEVIIENQPRDLDYSEDQKKQTENNYCNNNEEENSSDNPIEEISEDENEEEEKKEVELKKEVEEENIEESKDEETKEVEFLGNDNQSGNSYNFKSKNSPQNLSPEQKIDNEKNNKSEKDILKNILKFGTNQKENSEKLDNNQELIEIESVEGKKSSSFASERDSFSMEISSKRLSISSSDEYTFKLNFLNNKGIKISNSRMNQNKNLSFSKNRMREIERCNQILLKKILTQKSTYDARTIQNKTMTNNRPASVAINRKRQQRQIDMHNLMLQRKLEAIASRKRLH